MRQCPQALPSAPAVRRIAAAHGAACSSFAFPRLPTESPCVMHGLRLLGTYVRAHAAFRLPVRGNTRRRRGGRSHPARRCRRITHDAGRRCPTWLDSKNDPRPSGFHRCTYHWCNAGDAIDPNLQHVIHRGAGIEPLVLGKSTIAGIQRKVNLFNRILINADEHGHILVPVDLHARSMMSLADFDTAKPGMSRPNGMAGAPPLNGFATRRQR